MPGKAYATHQACARDRRISWFLGVVVFLTATLVFALGMLSEPHFADESAFVAQSYFYDLAVQGDRHDSAWLEYPAYDLPPLPKYLIGVALHTAGFQTPRRRDAMAWYRNVNRR